jgi:hypothetical protein
MAAGKLVFPLQCQETKEVLMSGLHFEELEVQKRISLPEADDVV